MKDYVKSFLRIFGGEFTIQNQCNSPKLNIAKLNVALMFYSTNFCYFWFKFIVFAYGTETSSQMLFYKKGSSVTFRQKTDMHFFLFHVGVDYFGAIRTISDSLLHFLASNIVAVKIW